RAGGEMPTRHHHSIPVPGGQDASLLIMPAWQAGQHIGIKVLAFFPDNGKLQKPSLMGAYLLFDGKTGEPLMQIDASALTARRTAAASALAASYLARPDCERLLMVGTEPLIQGHWLPLGVHLDLVGGFRPEMREADDDCIRRARVFVDTRAGALAEAGDIIQPLKSGVLREDDIAGDLFELARGSRAGRRYHDQITLFKSVGMAIEDLAAARLALDNVVHSSAHSTI